MSDIQDRRDFTADMVDQIFSYGELGFQEFETSRYLVDLLRGEGFTVEEGAWLIDPAISLDARWHGAPVLARLIVAALLGSPDFQKQ